MSDTWAALLVAGRPGSSRAPRIALSESTTAGGAPSTLTWPELAAACPGLRVLGCDLLAAGDRRHPRERLPDILARLTEFVGPRRTSRSAPGFLWSIRALRVAEKHLQRLAEGAGGA